MTLSLFVMYTVQLAVGLFAFAWMAAMPFIRGNVYPLEPIIITTVYLVMFMIVAFFSRKKPSYKNVKSFEKVISVINEYNIEIGIAMCLLLSVTSWFDCLERGSIEEIITVFLPVILFKISHFVTGKILDIRMKNESLKSKQEITL